MGTDGRTDGRKDLVLCVCVCVCVQLPRRWPHMCPAFSCHVILTDLAIGCYLDRGVEYEFRLSARNAVDYGDVTTSTIRTPDGSESRDRDPTWPPTNYLRGDRTTHQRFCPPPRFSRFSNARSVPPLDAFSEQTSSTVILRA